MTVKPWKILESKYLFPDVRIDRCELPNGQIIEPITLVYEPEVTIFALTKEKEVVLIKEYRHGVQEIILQLPGGSVYEGENPLEAAQRELLEETGYQSDTFIEIGRVNPNPANYANTMYAFLALEVEQAIDRNPNESDQIEIMLIPFDNVIAKAKNGELLHSLTISTIFFALAQLGRIN